MQLAPHQNGLTSTKTVITELPAHATAFPIVATYWANADSTVTADRGGLATVSSLGGPLKVRQFFDVSPQLYANSEVWSSTAFEGMKEVTEEYLVCCEHLAGVQARYRRRASQVTFGPAQPEHFAALEGWLERKIAAGVHRISFPTERYQRCLASPHTTIASLPCGSFRAFGRVSEDGFDMMNVVVPGAHHTTGRTILAAVVAQFSRYHLGAAISSKLTRFKSSLPGYRKRSVFYRRGSALALPFSQRADAPAKKTIADAFAEVGARVPAESLTARMTAASFRTALSDLRNPSYSGGRTMTLVWGVQDGVVFLQRIR